MIEDITNRLGRGRADGEKARLARKLGQEADSLLTCADYNRNSQDCKNCRAIAARRKRLMWCLLKNIKPGRIIITGTKRRPQEHGNKQTDTINWQKENRGA